VPERIIGGEFLSIIGAAIVPTSGVSIIALNTQAGGQSLTLQCSVTALPV